MTRIALVSPYTLPFSCGNSILAERLREGLVNQGYSVALFNARENTPAKGALFAPDILHTLNADRTYQWAREFRAAYKKIPWVITLTGTDYNTWSAINEPPAHIRESIEQANALVVFHRFAAEAVLSCLPGAGTKTHIIAQGVTPCTESADRGTVRSRYGIDSNAVIFLMVAGIRPVKSMRTAIEAFHEVQRQVPQAVLLLVGPVIDQSEAEKVLSAGGRLQCFTYLGEFAPAEVRSLMDAADVFLNTSLHEGMPGAVLEAMAAGLPVIASAVAGNRALIADDTNGFLFPVEDTKELIATSVVLAQDRKLRERLGEAGKQLVAANYSAEREIANYHQIYGRLLSG
jgi:glycosyltransferase involved in cell wall biosynthesis